MHLRVINRMDHAAGRDADAQYHRLKDAFRLAEWSVDEFNNRNLFSDHFLKNRLRVPGAFPAWDTDVRPAHAGLQRHLADREGLRNLAPTDLRKRFVDPIMRTLGFTAAPTKGADAEADYLLTAGTDKTTGADETTAPLAALLVYPWDRPLDRKDDSPGRDRAEDVPGMRVVRAMERHNVPWAILTNGKDWRLYCAKAHSRASNYYEVDLLAVVERDDLVAFRYFFLFFRAEAFTSAPPAGCFLDQVRQGSLDFAKELGDRLRDHVFKDVFPYLAEGFVHDRKTRFEEKTAAGDPFLDEVYDATLTLLYRLLFLLYAESLDLLPVNEPAYAEISLARLKGEIAAAAGNDSDAVEERLKSRLERSETKLYARLSKLFTVIAEGAKDRNVPAYNGGLFQTKPRRDDASREAAAARFLAKYRVPDFFLARALDLLARDEDSKTHELVNVDYKALGVRQLGNIYEGLLIYHVVIPPKASAAGSASPPAKGGPGGVLGKRKNPKKSRKATPTEDASDDAAWMQQFRRPGLRVALVPSNKKRKSTGSYFTPQHIVKYIVTNTVGPLLEEKFAAAAPKLREAQQHYRQTRDFEHKRAEKLRSQPRGDEAIATDTMVKFEPAVWDLLDLKVLDPAAGSGHFLVETVDYITDRLLDFLAGFPWNPVQVLIELRIRRQIIDSLDA